MKTKNKRNASNAAHFTFFWHDSCLYKYFRVGENAITSKHKLSNPNRRSFEKGKVQKSFLFVRRIREQAAIRCIQYEKGFSNQKILSKQKIN